MKSQRLVSIGAMGHLVNDDSKLYCGAMLGRGERKERYSWEPRYLCVVCLKFAAMDWQAVNQSETCVLD